MCVVPFSPLVTRTCLSLIPSARSNAIVSRMNCVRPGSRPNRRFSSCLSNWSFGIGKYRASKLCSMVGDSKLLPPGALCRAVCAREMFLLCLIFFGPACWEFPTHPGARWSVNRNSYHRRCKRSNQIGHAVCRTLRVWLARFFACAFRSFPRAPRCDGR